jgi:hypothetical protein
MWILRPNGGPLNFGAQALSSSAASWLLRSEFMPCGGTDRFTGFDRALGF